MAINMWLEVSNAAVMMAIATGALSILLLLVSLVAYVMAGIWQ